jgi:hypothetical protein
MNTIDKSWARLARLAAQAPPDAPDLPLGFATRTAAAWVASPSEGFFASLERLTWRGLGVALVILGGCAAFGYDSLASVFSGEVTQAGTYLSDLLGI